jgi:microcystin-dependent protein
MPVSALSPISLQTFFYPSGELVRPARLFFYHPDTVDPLTVYADHLLGVPHPVPVLTGGSGRVPPVYVGEEPYRIRVYDSYGSLVEDIPWLPGALAPSDGGGGGGETAVTEIKTGDYVLSFNNSNARAGYVRANCAMIGPPGFSGSGFEIERLNVDCEALFKHLWSQDFGLALTVVPGGYGASANDDWLANKAISLPDVRGCNLCGLDGMGSTHSGILDAVTFGVGSAGFPGSWGGSPFTTQTVAQMPGHTHAIQDPGHTHALPVDLIPMDAAANLNAYTYSAVASEAFAFPNSTGITILSNGFDQPMQTMSPFHLVCVYIKL